MTKVTGKLAVRAVLCPWRPPQDNQTEWLKI